MTTPLWWRSRIPLCPVTSFGRRPRLTLVASNAAGRDNTGAVRPGPHSVVEQTTVFRRASLERQLADRIKFVLMEEWALLNQIARMAITYPRRVIVVAALLTLALAIFGVPVANSLSASGFQDPTSESARASQLLTDKFSQGDTQLLVTVSTPDGVDSPAARAAGTEIVDQLRSSPHVVNVVSPWTTPPQAAAD